MVHEKLDAIGADSIFLNQRDVARCSLEYTISDKGVTGRLTIGDQSYALEDFVGVYTRLMDHQFLPEIEQEPEDSPLRAHANQFHDVLAKWYEITPGRVVNRTRPMGSNCSKPYQAQIIRKHGFEIPETLITNQPEQVDEFRKRLGRIIYKSISGERSIIQEFTDEDLERMERIRWCPVQFQEFVEGTDVRVHTIGDEVFPSAIHSDAADYRYAGRQGEDEARVEATTIDDDVAARCLELARSLDLPFAGIDLRITEDGRIFCFEVNPSPAYSYYEANTNQPISEAVARYLVGGN